MIAKKREVHYKCMAAYAVKTIRWRGRIWECARLAFESGKHYDADIERMLEERIIVPAKKPDGGYVLPL